MILPISFDNLECDDTVGGDLVVTSGVLYFFPHTNLIELRNTNQQMDRFGLPGAILATLNTIATGVHRRGTNRSRLHRTGLWQVGDSDATLREKLDVYVLQLRQNSKWLIENSELRPLRYTQSEINRLHLSSEGNLRVYAAKNVLQLVVGKRRRSLLVSALREGGFHCTEEEKISITPKRSRDAKSAFNNGVLHLDAGRWLEAAENFNQAVKQNPDWAQAQYNLGLACYRLGRLQESADAFTKAIQINDRDVDAYSCQGSAYLALNRLPDAIEAFQRAISIDPHHAGAHNNLALAYFRVGCRELAIREYEILKGLDACQAAELLRAISGPQR